MKRAFLALLLTTAPGLALAAPPAKSPPAKAEPAKALRLDFAEGDQVEGEMARPDGELVDATRKARMPSLLRPRTTFHYEMLKSAESI